MMFVGRILLESTVDLNSPGTYVHWSVFDLSLSNVILIVVMVVIFGIALVVPFPGHHERESLSSPGGAEQEHAGIVTAAEVAALNADSAMWTARLRNLALRYLPPGKLLPDRQPAYVASWIYVFGVASIAALIMVILSGCLIALGGVDWWHTNRVGHFFNSLHLWSVELFMAFLVIHLWGKFWMAAWRGRRSLTWMTGVMAFAISVLECFTGYLSQQNFDSQWISTSGKDAFNAVGIGGFFNPLNFGQMMIWHVVLIPVMLISMVGVHVLLVRIRGVVPPIPTTRPRGAIARRERRRIEAQPWSGPTRRYDIVKEATGAVVIVLVLVVALATLLSSPNDPPVTIASWSHVAPADFLATAASELAGTSETATYGPPYNHQSGSVQKVGPGWQMLAGVRIPVDAAATFVLDPLGRIALADPTLAGALRSYNEASAKIRQSWANTYLNAVTKVTFTRGALRVPVANYGPVGLMMSTELAYAQAGAIDTDLLAQRPFYGSDYTKPLLFIEDGSYFSSLATSMHLTGSQWGVMNESGSYPGQPWLWLYTLWYQLPGFSSSPNVDVIAVYLTGAATILLLSVPFLPGLRDIPRWIPLHRLVWRRWNHLDDHVPVPPDQPVE